MHARGNSQQPASLGLIGYFGRQTARDGDTDGAHTFGGGKTSDDGLGRHGGPDGQEGIGELPERPLNANVGATAESGLEFVKRKAMVRVDDPPNFAVTCGEAPERACFGTVRVDDVELPGTEERLQVGESLPVVSEGDIALQMLLDDDLKACGFRLLDESVATADDEHDLIAVGVQRQSTSQGDAPRASHEAGHDLGDANRRVMSTPRCPSQWIRGCPAACREIRPE